MLACTLKDRGRLAVVIMHKPTAHDSLTTATLWALLVIICVASATIIISERLVAIITVVAVVLIA